MFTDRLPTEKNNHNKEQELQPQPIHEPDQQGPQDPPPIPQPIIMATVPPAGVSVLPPPPSFTLGPWQNP